MNNKKNVISLIIGYIGTVLSLFLLILLINPIYSLPVLIRMPLLIITYPLLFIVPFIMSLLNKDSFKDYGFSKAKIPLQILLGLIFGIAFSFFFTLLPHMCGLGSWFSSGYTYSEWWQFVYEFAYSILGVALTEELIFRGFFFIRCKKIFTVSENKKQIISPDLAAIIISSVLFGLYHFMQGNIFQVICTSFLGILFCLMRKIKNCTTLSVIITHGVYDALIVVITSCLTK